MNTTNAWALSFMKLDFAFGDQMLHGTLFEKTVPLDPLQKLFIYHLRTHKWVIPGRWGIFCYGTAL
jgi:hypothetical protein